MPTYDAGDASINIRPSLRGFKGELESELKKIDASIEVSVHPGLAQAKADLARWRAQEESKAVDIPIKTHYDQSGRKAMDDIKRDAEELGGKLASALKWNAGALGVGSLPAIATALATVAGSLQQVAQAGLAVPGIMGGATASIGTLVLGLSGVKDAYDAVTKASASANDDQAAQVKANTAAHQALRNAVVDDAQAHKDLSQAYQDARQRLQDLNIEQRGGAISEAQAINDAKKARRDLAQGRFKDALDYQDAVLRVEAADQRVVEARQRNIDLQQKVTQENAKGIEQSDEVVSAKEKIVRADQQVSNAQQAVTDATIKQSAAQKDAAQAMAKLSPQAQLFLQTVIGLKPEFSALKNTVQDNIFGGLSEGLKTLVSADLPNLQKGLGGIATAWNQNIKQLFTSLGSDSTKGLLDRVLGDTKEAQQRFTKAIDPIVHAIGTLTAGSSDALPRLADGIGKVADRFDKFITAADADGRLRKWINDGLTGMTRLGDITLNLVTSFTAVSRAAGGGDGLLAILQRGTKSLSDFLNSAEGQQKLTRFFREGREQLAKWLPILGSIPGLMKGVVDGAKEWSDVALPLLRTLTSVLGDNPKLIQDVVLAFLTWKTINPVISGVSTLMGGLSKGLIELGTGFSKTREKAGSEMERIKGAFNEADKGGVGKLSGSVAALGAAAGGPFGILAATIASVAIPALLDLTHKQTDAKVAADAHNQSLQQLAGTLNQITNLAGQKTRDDLAKQASDYKPTDKDGNALGLQGNALRAAIGLGIKDQDYITAALPGGNAQYDQIQSRLREQVRPIIRQSIGADQMDLLAKYGADENTVVDAFLGGTGALEKFRAARDKAVGVLKATEQPERADLIDLGAVAKAVQSAGGPALDAALAGQFLNAKRADTSGAVTGANAAQAAAAGTRQLTARGHELFDRLGAPQVHFDGDRTAVTVDNLPPDIRKQFESTGDQIVEPVPGQPRWTIILAPDNAKIDAYDKGGPTPSGKGNGPTGGFISELHDDEFVANKRGRTVLGDAFLHAANMGIVDIGRLPGFEPGGFIEPDGTVVHSGSGAAPGPADGGAALMGGAANPVLSGFLSGLGLGGGQSAAAAPGVGAGLAGLFQAGDDTTKQGAWLDQTGDWLGQWAGSTLGKIGGALYQGVLGFFGLGNSILSPSNPWFQAGLKSLGVNFGNGTDSQGIGTQYQTLGDGSVLATPTFGTAGVPGSVGGGPLNALSKASSLGGANVNYTPDFLLANGIAPLYTRSTDKDGNSVPQIPDWANKLAAAFGLTATSHSDSTLHGGQSGKGDSTNPNAGWAFDFSGKPEDEQRFADFIQSKLSGQTLQAIWQNPGTGQQLGIAGGQLLARDQYYTTKGGAYADHTDHVHWATDVAPVLWDPATGKSLVPGVPDMPGGKRGVDGLMPGSGGLPVPLPAGASGGGQGALMNLALAAARGTSRGGDPASNKALAQQIFGEYFPASEWAAFDTLEMHEAGYDNTAKNPASTAYGMGQFLDATWGSYGAKTSDPATQLRYMLEYIKRRYGTPSAAWAQYYNHPGGVGWYDYGGWLQPGLSMMLNQTGKPEAVLNPAQTQAYQTVAAHLEKQGANIAPTVPNLPDIQHKRGATPIPSAPTTQLPAPVAAAPMPTPAPLPISAGADTSTGPAPAQQQSTQPTIAAAPQQDSHLLPAVQQGITEGASTLGNLAATAISMGAGGLAGGGGAGAGTLVQGLFNLGGKAASGIANVFASALVGNLGDNTTAGAYGAPVVSAPPQPAQPIDNSTHFGDVQVGDPREFVEQQRLYEQQRSQAQEGYVR